MKPIDKHNLKLQERNIPYKALVPYASGSNPINKYICDKGHEFKADRARIMAQKTFCPTCKPTKTALMTHEQYEQRLMEINAQFYPIEKYQGTITKINHMCINEHIHSIMPASVLNPKNGCPFCSGHMKKTTESYTDELITKGIKYIPIEEYINIMTKIMHKCYHCGHEWSIKPHDILYGNGCPVCAAMGFNRGKPAILYYVKLWDENRVCYKIGVTNKTVEQRLRNCGKNYKILMQKHYETGAEAETREQILISENKDQKAYAPKWLKTGGNSELFISDVLDLDLDSRPLSRYNALSSKEK